MATSRGPKWSYYIEADRCMTCGTCEVECREGAVYVKDLEVYAIDSGKCRGCGRCFQACPVGAVVRVPAAAAS
ncbi:MAG: 4Fe-4S binding protein [Clostridia bacterium]|jgi:ferredoxin|nr:4Fe-4S binding protein [Clostridia bacterium]MDH7572044.1 4Fe-4S binding protein [Clostridia bacterium]